MTKKELVFLYLFSVAFFFALALLQKVPGYMDAEYYFGRSVALAAGNGWTENFIWNFLNDPVAIPVPAFGFWMPLTSMLGALGVSVTRSSSFLASRLPFILLAAFIPVLAAAFAAKLSAHRYAGWLSGALALASGMFLPYLTITDTFTPYMVFGGLFFVICYKIQTISSSSKFIAPFIFLGVICGLMALTRSDGILWLVGAFFLILFSSRNDPIGRRILFFFLTIIGFAVIMLPWYLRNLGIYKSILPPGNSLMLWLSEYGDLFHYPASELTAARWASEGIGNLLTARMSALLSNLQTLAIVGGSVFLFPIIVIGAWKNRKETVVLIASIMIFVLLTLMSFVFPFAGARGGFFHALAGTQVIWWALVPAGLEAIVLWAQKHRNWQIDRAWKMFAPTLVVIAVLFSGINFLVKLGKGAEGAIPWNGSLDRYTLIEENLPDHADSGNGVAMVNDPPGFTLATNRHSVMIPSGGIQSILAVAEQFDVQYLILDSERSEVQSLLQQSASEIGNINLITTLDGVEIYEFCQ